MARSQQLRYGQEYGPVIAGERNADGTTTPLFQSEYVAGATSILAGQSLSAEIDTGGRRLAGIIMPAAWTAAALTFQVALALGGVYRDLYDDQGNEVAIQAAALRAIGLDAVAYALAPYRALKMRSGTAASTVAQVAQADLGLIFKG